MDILSIKGKLPFEILESISNRGISSFTPPQEDAIKKGLLTGENFVIASPTASGKTLIAEIACANAILSQRRKAVYIAPMRALVMEKYNEFKAAYPYLKSAMSIGDLDSNDQWLQSYDVLFVSTEKFDSLLRHGISWLSQIGCIVFDEIHMLGESSRGPTLEILITKLANSCDAQIIALSATVGNAREIAKWLDAELVESEYRPVKLKKGVVNDGKAYYLKNDDYPVEIQEDDLGGNSQIPEIRVLEDTLEQSKQVLIFYATKRNAEAGAVRLAKNTEDLLTKEDKVKLDQLGDEILNALDRPTEQCIKLSGLVKRGIAFHHAGLLNTQREKVENGFKGNIIKAICSTTTLGLGVNLPAHTVLVRDINRYEGGISENMGVNEITQLFGRAGRPKYDKEGRALVIATSKERVAELYKNYILAKPEAIDSNLGVIPVLRTHILAFISEGFLNDKKSILGFLAKTFYGFQYKNDRHIRNILDEIINELIVFEFVVAEGDIYRATKVGKRVSELYIDPISARWMLNSMDRKLDDVGALYMISNTIEMRPYVRPTEDAEAGFATYRYMFQDKSLMNDYESLDSGYYDPVRAFTTALMLKDWIDEEKDPDIIKKYKSTPGELYNKLSNADWMIYSAIELAKLTRKPVHDMVNIRVRLRYGIKEELLDLVRLQQVGRVRARAMYRNGIKTISDIRANNEAVKKLFGKEIADKIIEQLN